MAALPLIARAIEKIGARTVTIEKIEISGVNKTPDQLLQDIVAAAERASAAGGVSFNIRTG